MKLATGRWIVAALLHTVAFASAAAPAASPPVAAASDLKFALEEIAAEYKADAGVEVRLTFGSSGNFVRQIAQGAPFELFLSADEELVFALAEQGLTRDRGVLYAIGRIVLFVPPGSPIAATADLRGLRRALGKKQVRRFAIANPEHAPYGWAAEQALRHANLWEPLQGHLILGENVTQAAQFAVSGNSDGGIIAYSLAVAPTFKERGQFALIPDTWHPPLRQRMALLRNATPEAEGFYRYLQSAPARAVMSRYGFTLPNE